MTLNAPLVTSDQETLYLWAVFMTQILVYYLLRYALNLTSHVLDRVIDQRP